MRSIFGVLLGVFAVLVARPGLAQELVMDSPTVIGGIETVCTGVGLDARADPRWSAYGLKVEVAGEGGRYLGGEVVRLSQNGNLLLEAGCTGPWLLFRLPAGRYDVEVRVGDQAVSSAAFVPAQGQGRIILRFTDNH